MIWFQYAFARATGDIIPAGRYTREFDQYYQFGDDQKVRGKAKDKLRYVSKLTGSNRLIIENRSKVSTMDGKTVALARMAGLHP